ncbi:permease [Longirhabdus pacifica]|uniref:permease n=1 Tax=Longirhabdus pacifica TaxID=2305227 RepID=UPI0010090EF7|nr:permease [Longirhabdus pacifica]
MKTFKAYRLFVVLLFVLSLVTLWNQTMGWNAIQLTGKSMLDMLLLLPPILIFVSVLDTWLEKDALVKYMGKDAGLYGIVFALLLGTVAAGPLYIAFPISVILLRKGASLRYIVFFLGVWSTTKIHVVIFELTSFGPLFSFLRISFCLLFFYMMGVIFEKIYDRRPSLQRDMMKQHSEM